MNPANERLIFIRYEQGRRSLRHRHGILALILTALLGAGIIAALVMLTMDAAAQTASKDQASGSPVVPNVPNSPECGPNWVIVGDDPPNSTRVSLEASKSCGYGAGLGVIGPT